MNFLRFEQRRNNKLSKFSAANTNFEYGFLSSFFAIPWEHKIRTKAKLFQAAKFFVITVICHFWSETLTSLPQCILAHVLWDICFKDLSLYPKVLLKSVHFKKTVARSSFLSKLWYIPWGSRNCIILRNERTLVIEKKCKIVPLA